MEIQYTKRRILESGIGAVEGPYWAPLGCFLFVEKACYFGVLPPYSILNKMLSDGYTINPNNVYLSWQSFQLNKHEYARLKRSIELNPKWGGEIDESYKGNRAYWEHWAMQRLSSLVPPKASKVAAVELQAG